MSFYRKHRPTKIDELDLASVRNSFYSISKNLDSLSHGFLFAGPRGSGKTSSARILAKLANCENPKEAEIDGKKYFEPCNSCENCMLINGGSSLDVIEVDAASNRGIDDIRALRDNVSLAPAKFKYKFYIMDEAHMLTTEAANAFLKTLEEPPSHVVFILATTDPQKLPETVLSRLTLIHFQKATADEIKRQLTRVSSLEKLDIKEDVFDLIIQKSDGSFRDSVKLLETISNEEDFSFEKISSVIDTTSLINYEKFWESIVNKDLSESQKIFTEYSSKGGSVKDLIEKLTQSFRDLLLDNSSGLSQSEVLGALKLLLEARENYRRSHISSLSLEMFLAEWCQDTRAGKEKVLKKKPKEKKNGERKKLDELSWAKILSGVKEKNASVEALLRAAKPMGVSGNVFNLGVYYRFHKERLEKAELKRALEEVVENVLGGPLTVVCSLEEKREDSDLNGDDLTGSGDKDIISAAKEIFG